MAESLSEAQINDYKEAFSLFDEKGSGFISYESMESVLQCMGLSFTKARSAVVLKELDKDSKGKIEFKAFLSYVTKTFNRNKDDEKMIREAFFAFTQDECGHITTADLRTALQKMERGPSAEEIDEVVQYMESTGDNEISFESFAKILMSFKIEL